MQASTIRDFRVVLESLYDQPFKKDQYLLKFRPYKWSKAKSLIYLKVLKEFGLIRLDSLITATIKGKGLISLSKEKGWAIFIKGFFKLLKNFELLRELLGELKIIFLGNPNLSIKKLAKKSKMTRRLGTVGQYVVSIIISSFFLHNELPREEKYLELIAKSFINLIINRDGISYQELIQIAADYRVNIKKIKVELLKRWEKSYHINFPNEIVQVLTRALESKSVYSLPILINLDDGDFNLTKTLIDKYPQTLQFVKFSKNTNKMKLKITEEIFTNDLVITFK